MPRCMLLPRIGDVLQLTLVVLDVLDNCLWIYLDREAGWILTRMWEANVSTGDGPPTPS